MNDPSYQQFVYGEQAIAAWLAQGSLLDFDSQTDDPTLQHFLEEPS